MKLDSNIWQYYLLDCKTKWLILYFTGTLKGDSTVTLSSVGTERVTPSQYEYFGDTQNATLGELNQSGRIANETQTDVAASLDLILPGLYLSTKTRSFIPFAGKG